MALVLSAGGSATEPTEDPEATAAIRERPVRWVGKYRILSELGRGGMANVYLAVARGPGGVSKLVVLKALLPELASEPSALAMFLDEARLAAQLNHANVVQTYEVGTEGERQVIVMEYLEGQSLGQTIKRAEAAGQTVSMAMYLRVMIGALEGLHYAHELCAYDGSPLTLVHRDVSPQNIFVTYDGQVKVLDFGIAKAASSSTHTATGIVKGKIAYMAPEQMVGDNVDRRADIYSVGCMLWAIATGKKLWKDTPDVHIMRRVINGEVPSPQSVSPAVDDDLNRIVLKSLAAERDERYQTALELQEDLEQYCDKYGLTMKQKELGNIVSTLFADTRADLKALIERQLSIAANDEFVATGDFSSRSEVRSSISRSGQSVVGAEISQQSGTQPGASAASRAIWLVPILALGAAAIYFLRPLPPPPAPAPTQVQAAEPPPAPTENKVELVTVQFRVDPSEAKLFLDGQPLPSNPTSKVLPVNGAVHRLRAEAPGYSPRVAEFSPSKDDTLAISLTKLDEPNKSTPQRYTGRHTGKAAATPPTSPKPPETTPTPPTQPQPKANNCSQPFYVGQDGIKRIRPECM